MDGYLMMACLLEIAQLMWVGERNLKQAKNIHESGFSMCYIKGLRVDLCDGGDLGFYFLL